MSITRFRTQNIAASNITDAIITGKSFILIAFIINSPTPGIPNNVSAMIVPPSKYPKSIPIIVTTGIMAFLRQCFNIILSSPEPFDLAVLT